MAAAHGRPCTWLENGPELHAACCKVNRRHVLAHSAALFVLTRSASHPQGSPLVTQCACIVPSATTPTAYIRPQHTSGSSLTRILSVPLAMGRRDGLSATRHVRDSDTG